jgi:hypothetical protein
MTTRERDVRAADVFARADSIASPSIGRMTDLLEDRRALDAIHEAMDGVAWNSDLWDEVAEIVLGTGRPAFRSPDDDLEVK